jgi:hypothetical protein
MNNHICLNCKRPSSNHEGGVPARYNPLSPDFYCDSDGDDGDVNDDWQHEPQSGEADPIAVPDSTLTEPTILDIQM